MGCFMDRELPELERNKTIDHILKHPDKESKLRGHVKLLLLGTGDSGKSTFIKQMKNIHKGGFSHNEMLTFQNVVRSNCLSSIQRIFNHASSIKHRFSDDVMEQKNMIEEARELTPEVALAIKKVWEDKNVKKYIKNYENELQIPSSSDYYFTNCERYVQPEFVPNNEDILRCKLKTTGIIETKFEEQKVEFTLVDVGGQRAERRKWLHCFDDVDAVIYLAALDEYNMVLYEDGTTNRMEESLNLFKDVTGSQWFSEKAFILFLNKSDLFKKKIKRAPLRTCSYLKKEATEEHDVYEKAIEFMKAKYRSYYASHLDLFIHVTCALDEGNCKFVFESVRNTIMKLSLESGGFSEF